MASDRAGLLGAARPRRVVFVCAGNICRSPLAEAWFRRLQDPARHIETWSSGLIAEPDDRVIPETLAAARAFGLALEAHRARRFAADDIQASDLVLVMEHAQLLDVTSRLGGSRAAQVGLLGAFAPAASPEIADPFGGSEAVYRSCVSRIEQCVRGLLLGLPQG